MTTLRQRRKHQAAAAIPTRMRSIRDVHTFTGIPIRTLQAWAQKGRVKAVRDGAKLWYVSLSDVQHVAATLRPGPK